ncbi:MAG: molybdopterin-dependent oxidoreductase [Dehalococcoidia bacterium]|nr:molybdopterin-dependent oxidoreductase [Dehalococcoidia bacterium]
MAEEIFTNCTVGGPILVHVRDGRIVRIRPLIYNETDAPSWTIKARGRQFSPPRKAAISPFAVTERTHVYSENRIKYPMIRVDFNPDGEIHLRRTENRGMPGYVRISWDEALDIVAGEIKRIQTTYGKEAITGTRSSHHNWGIIGYHFSVFLRFMTMLGFTPIDNNPDSWEGWYWGASHAYGFYWRLGMPEQYDLLEDCLKNTELIVHWGSDPDSTRISYGGQESAIWRLWLKELGVKNIFIDPYHNYTSCIHADKWIAPRPGTDAAMAEAIAYVWLTEGTYDKEYVATHTLGFDEWKSHILGKEDGIARTPQWAEGICGVPARVITALAREWASKRTTLDAGSLGGMSGACRQAYATEWARLMVYLQATQGLGKPGVSIWGTTAGVPFNAGFRFPGYSFCGIDQYARKSIARKTLRNPVSQRLYRHIFPDAILNPPVSWLFETTRGASLDQFHRFTYPEEGKSECHMYYRHGSSFIGTMTETNKWVKALQSPKLECIVAQDCWWSSETRFADIILPACTNLERNDISMFNEVSGYMNDSSAGTNHRVVIYQKKCIEPLWESRPDYDIYSDLADRLGFKEDYTEGKTPEDWIKDAYDNSSLPQYISWEDFKKKGYYVVPTPEDYKPTPALRWFYEGRECDTPDNNPKKNTSRSKELGTYSGKIEFISQSLLQNLPDDKERPPVARYIPSWEGYQSELAKKYPLQLIAPHPRFSFHTHHDNHVTWLGDIPGHRMLKDGYQWQTVRIHPVDAGARGIRNGDIVRLYNDRGSVLGIARVTERVRPGVVHSYGSASKYDPLEPGKPYSTDRGGCVNLLTSSRTISKNVAGMAPNSCLIEIARWEDS